MAVDMMVWTERAFMFSKMGYGALEMGFIVMDGREFLGFAHLQEVRKSKGKLTISGFSPREKHTSDQA